MSNWKRYLLPALTLGMGIILALFRNAIKDETIYLNDAAWMAECLRHGNWFGNEGVGLHGFIFKLPAAIFFLCFGRSVFLATATTVLMGAAAIWMTQRVLLKLLDSENLAFVGTWLVLTVYHFVQCLPTFMRDIPALLAVLLFVEAVMNRRDRWLTGFLLMLVMDAKEGVFFMVAPAFAIWVILDELRGPAGSESGRPKARQRIAGRWLAGFLFPVLYVVLMMCTGIVPFNQYLARFLGLTEGWIGGAATDFVSWNPAGNAVGRYRILPMPGVPEGAWHWPVALLGHTVFYVGKLFHPKTFSIMTVSKVLIVPALAVSVRLFREWYRSGEAKLLFLPLVMWTFVVEYQIGVTVGRYLLPAVPVFVYFFLRFLQYLGDRRYILRILAGTTIALCLELVYERYLLPIKIVVAFCPVLLLGASALLHRHNPRLAEVWAIVAALVLGGMGAAASLAASWSTAQGQLCNFVRFGHNRQCERIVSEIPDDTCAWISCDEWSALPRFYRGERPSIEDVIGGIRQWVPKVRLMRQVADADGACLWTGGAGDVEALQELVRRERIEKVLAVISRTRRVKFMNQDLAESLLHEDWLEMERRIPAKNQNVYVLSVKQLARDDEKSR